MCGFCNVWMCVCVYIGFCNVYVYFFLMCYYFKDYCHRVIFAVNNNIKIIIIIEIIIIKQYIKRHDTVCAQLHFNTCKKTGVQLDKKQWCEHVPKSVETSQGGEVTILWNQQAQTTELSPTTNQTL